METHKTSIKQSNKATLRSPCMFFEHNRFEQDFIAGKNSITNMVKLKKKKKF